MHYFDAREKHRNRFSPEKTDDRGYLFCCMHNIFVIQYDRIGFWRSQSRMRLDRIVASRALIDNSVAVAMPHILLGQSAVQSGYFLAWLYHVYLLVFSQTDWELRKISATAIYSQSVEKSRRFFKKPYSPAFPFREGIGYRCQPCFAAQFQSRNWQYSSCARSDIFCAVPFETVCSCGSMLP